MELELDMLEHEQGYFLTTRKLNFILLIGLFFSL